jgi:hypothetical protein
MNVTISVVQDGIVYHIPLVAPERSRVIFLPSAGFIRSEWNNHR